MPYSCTLAITSWVSSQVKLNEQNHNYNNYLRLRQSGGFSASTSIYLCLSVLPMVLRIRWLRPLQGSNTPPHLGWLRLVVLLEVGLERRWCIQRGVHFITGLWTFSTGTTAIGRRLCIFSTCAVWLYLHSTCLCAQICIFISQRNYLIETSPNNIRPQP